MHNKQSNKHGKKHTFMQVSASMTSRHTV